MDSSERPGGTDALAWLPPLWLAVVMAISTWAIWATWQFLGDYELSGSILYFFRVAAAIDAVTILWGGWLLSLAARRSPAFPKQFVIWQVFEIGWLAVSEIYTLAAPDFLFSPRSTAMTLAKIAIGVFCIAILRRGQASASVSEPAGPRSAPQPASPGYTVFVALLGLVLGGAAGFGLGMAAGVAIVEATAMSCFEGACGFFVFFLALGGLLVGAIAGAVIAVRRVRRRARPAGT